MTNNRLANNRWFHNFRRLDSPLYRSSKNNIVVLLGFVSLSTNLLPTFSTVKFDELVKSRHSGENRSPDDLQLFEMTGFQLSPE